jgi:4'-phosphopantetheinyl transferase
MFMPERWTPAAQWTPLPPRTIDVWRLHASVRDEDWDLLRADEVDRARRIVRKLQAGRKAAARAHLRRVLARYCDVDPRALELEYEENGKPALVGHGRPSFNLSHSEHVVLLAVTERVRVGIDVEHARPGRPFEEIARRFFSARERDMLLALRPEARRVAFYRAWTRKEAYLKAHGTGLTFPSRRFTIDYTSDPGRLLETELPGDDPARWRFVDLQPEERFIAAMCHEGGEHDVRCWA